MSGGRRVAAIVFVLTAALVAACSDDSSPRASGSSSSGGTVTASTPSVARPAGPAADVSTVLTGGNGVFIGEATPASLPAGWVQEERAAAGTATSYQAADLPADGKFALTPGPSADYRTRILIRRPDAGHFNGTVVVEWLNVSGGVDASPDYSFMADEFAHGGYAWVG